MENNTISRNQVQDILESISKNGEANQDMVKYLANRVLFFYRDFTFSRYIDGAEIVRLDSSNEES